MKRLAALALMCISATAFGAVDSVFENIGMGGGGGIFASGMSPVDPNFMLTSSDMSGCYRTDNGGKSWRMINFTQINGAIKCKPYFHPTKVGVVMWKDKISTDKAWTWKSVSKSAPWGRGVTHCAVHGDSALAMYVGTAAGIWGSHDNGATWKQIASGACGGIHIMPDGTAYGAAGSSLYRWQAGRSEPAKVDTSGVSGSLRALAVGGAKAKHSIHVVGSGGVFTSIDSGASWKRSQSQGGIVDVVMAKNQANIAYSCDRMKCYVTKDGGGTWTSTFDMNRNAERSWVQTEIKWGYYITANGLNVCQGKGDFVMITTQGDIYASTDAGGSWKQLMNQQVGNAPGGRGGRYRGIGLEVTTTWDYLFDPWDPNRHYIAYTDIGFAYSVDKGKTWSYGGRGSPWGNTWYGVEFDPFIKGKMYGAGSSKHDIPHWTHCDANYRPGGVVVSENSGMNWKPISAGLPSRPVCGIAVDKKASKPNATVLYITSYGEGVYKSTDSGITWKKKPGVGRPGNYHVYQVRVHPKTSAVFVNVGANRRGRNFTPNGGLWKSTNGGDSWTELTTNLPLGWPNGFALHPENDNIIYLTAGTFPGPGTDQGGVYKTTDGGANWSHVLKNSDCPGYVQGMFIEMHPDDPNVLYFGGTRGLYASPNGGQSWRHMTEIPFSLCHRVRIDPHDKGMMYVTGFGGGIWRGPTMRGVPGEKAFVARPGPKSSGGGSSKPKPKPKPARPSGPSEADVAAAEEAGLKLRKAIIDGVASGKKVSVYIDLMGRPSRAKILAADEKGLKVRASGMETTIKWSRFSPNRFYGAAKKYSTDTKLLDAYRKGNKLDK